MRFPPTVNLVHSGSAFWARTSQTNLPQATVLCFRTCECLMKKMVSVPLIRSPTPCANLPSSFALDRFHTGLNCWSELSWRYVRALSVMGWIRERPIGIEYDGAWQYGSVVLTMMEYACRRERVIFLVGYRCGNRLEVQVRSTAAPPWHPCKFDCLCGHPWKCYDHRCEWWCGSAVEYFRQSGDGRHCVTGNAMERGWRGGLCRILLRFIAAMMMRSIWVSSGVLHFIGEKNTVSDIHSLPVSVTYTV
jgi:hypothetical protein